MAETKVALPKYSYTRGRQIYARIQDETGAWRNKRTPFTVDEIDKARKHIATLVRGYNAHRAADDGAVRLRGYGAKWVNDRERRGITSAPEERARLETYVYPILGDLELNEFRPRHARDFVRKLKSYTGDTELAPRTIIHLFRLLHSVFTSAVIDEYVDSNPIVVEPGELPEKEDADPEWRINATYTSLEINQLVTDPRIPMRRRVTYALKSLAGMRHGEVAAFCWRHVDESATPLWQLNVVQAFCSREKLIKSTKTGDLRAIPAHPVLAQLLHGWRVEWTRVYGREPNPDDLVVPTSSMRPVDGKDAGEALRRDLVLLGLRTRAGMLRSRGGHDMRSWFITQLISDGADSLVVHRFTHAPPNDVIGGYQRFAWSTLCCEASKLRLPNIEVLSRSAPSPKMQIAPSAAEAQYFGLAALERALNSGDTDLASAIVQRMRTRSAT